MNQVRNTHLTGDLQTGFGRLTQISRAPSQRSDERGKADGERGIHKI